MSTSPSFVRTLVPILVGPLLVRFVPHLDLSDPDVLLAVSAVISYVYYVAVRLLEWKAPKIGWLLGIPKQPAYSIASPPSPDSDERLEVEIVHEDPHGSEVPERQSRLAQERELMHSTVQFAQYIKEPIRDDSDPEPEPPRPVRAPVRVSDRRPKRPPRPDPMPSPRRRPVRRSGDG